MEYKEALDYLFAQLPMFSRVGAAAYKPGLDTSLNLDKFYGHPHRKFKSIHIGGTNGKGSTSHMIAAILQSQGYKVGLYTSPHLVDFRERIRVNGEMIPENDVVDFIVRFALGLIIIIIFSFINRIFFLFFLFFVGNPLRHLQSSGIFQHFSNGSGGFRRDMQAFSNFLRSGIPAQLRKQPLIHAAVIFQGSAHFLAHAVGTGLQGNHPCHGTTNPAVSTAFKITAGEIHNCLPQTEASLLNQVQQKDAVAGHFFGRFHITVQQFRSCPNLKTHP